jgi:hypothetical protein
MARPPRDKPPGPPKLRIVSGGSKTGPDTPAKDVVKKGPGGRPRHVPTDQLRALCQLSLAAGATLEDTARIMKIGLDVLHREYKDEIADGGATANLKVAGALFKMASDPNHPKCATAAIWWTKARMGWKDPAGARGIPEPDGAEDSDDEVEFTIGIGEKRGA